MISGLIWILTSILKMHALILALMQYPIMRIRYRLLWWQYRIVMSYGNDEYGLWFFSIRLSPKTKVAEFGGFTKDQLARNHTFSIYHHYLIIPK